MEEEFRAFLMSVNWMEWAKTIIDLLKGTAWPLSVVFIVWIFRREIRERIKDIVSLGMGGAVLQPSSQPNPVKPETGLKPEAHPLPTVRALAEKIEQQLAGMPPDTHVSRLIYALAEAQTERNFEFIWGLIFASQIHALRLLANEPSVAMKDAREYYENEIRPKNDGLKELSFDDWSRFLYGQNLISNVPPGRIAITDNGRDFLVYVDTLKQSFERPM